MRLSYKAVDKDGKIQQGLIQAKNQEEAVGFLRAKGFLPIRVEESTEEGFSLPRIFKRGHGKEMVLFTRQLSSMLSSGLTLVQALLILRDQLQNESIRDVTVSIISDVQEGKKFSEALTTHPEYFSQIYIALVAAGESSGFLDKILDRLATNLERSEKLRTEILSALLYPFVIIILMVVVVVIMMVFVIPQLTQLYSNLNITLPLPTQIVIGVSQFTISYWPVIIGIFVLAGVFYNRWSATQSGKLIRDDLLLRVPIFGKIIKTAILTEFSRTFGLLIGSGTLVVQALVKTANVANNLVYKNAIDDVAKRVEKGITVGDAISAYKIFPPMLVQMVHIGEQTGKLDESLLRVSEYYEHDVETAIKGLTTAMEPLIMVVLGVGVAFLIISVITPIYNLTSSIR